MKNISFSNNLFKWRINTHDAVISSLVSNDIRDMYSNAASIVFAKVDKQVIIFESIKHTL